MKKIENIIERLREKLAWWIFPEFGIYIEVAKIIGSTAENERILKALQDSDFRYKDGAIKIIKKDYTMLDLENHFGADIIKDGII